MRAFSRYANRVAGGLLVAAGGYIVLFWTLSLSAGQRATPGLVQGVELLSSRLTNALGSRPVAVGLTLAVLVIAGAVWARLARQRGVDAVTHGWDAGGTEVEARTDACDDTPTGAHDTGRG